MEQRPQAGRCSARLGTAITYPVHSERTISRSFKFTTPSPLASAGHADVPSGHEPHATQQLAADTGNEKVFEMSQKIDEILRVADTGNARIQKFTADGTFVMAWGSSGAGDGQIRTASAHRHRPGPDSHVFVAETGNVRVQKFTSDGVFGTNWGSFGTQRAAMQHGGDSLLRHSRSSRCAARGPKGWPLRHTECPETRRVRDHRSSRRSR